ncbi:Ger(x)C family spore germination protein [Alkalihalobacillus sp. BA299]|uniref:Ger(x)C family spore germination protein n=1 Tax=Alkalihalobacillus sp. BA299 TaxID=2815938 RepID=UPI001ADBE16A|nr:Ger(x)C family spore germination protein [Alkalihalobacillus sp. BA299]
MKRFSSYTLVFMLSTVLLTGCIQTNIIDELALIYAVGYDQAENNELEVTVTYPTFIEQGEESALHQKTISAVGKTTKGATDLINAKTQKPLKKGQARVFLFSDKIAEGGIEHLVDSLYRDPSVPNRVHLAVTEGKAKDAFDAVEEGDDRVGVFIPDLIDQIQQKSIPITNLHLFLFSMYNDGRDAFLPLLKADGELKVVGIALFDHDTYVDKLDLEESFVFRLLTTKGVGGSQQYRINHDDKEAYVVVENITSTYKNSLIKKGDNPTFDYHVKVRGEITDSSDRMNLDDPKLTAELEKQMEENLKETATVLVEKFKEKEIDPLGLGEKYRSRTRDWQPEKWKELYSNIEVKLTFDVEIVQSGAIE